MFRLSLSIVILTTTLSHTNSSMFTVEAERNKAFDESCLIGNFSIASGNISDCLEHCLENCTCQSFQVCQNTLCQLCSRNKKDNSSLLHDKEGCIYAMYKIQPFQKLDEQCSDMNFLTKYNCCQQTNLCSGNKICKPITTLGQPWKRFICECKDGYHGDNCDRPITSCHDYSNGSRISGRYKVQDFSESSYDVYCHFDSDGAWTLLQSCSFANGSYNSEFEEFQKPMWESHPVSENMLTWSGYRLSKARMESIKTTSTLLRFTCEFEKHKDVNKSDILQIFLKDLSLYGNEKIDDVLELGKNSTPFAYCSSNRGKIAELQLDECLISLYQDENYVLHVNVANEGAACEFSPLLSAKCNASMYYFGDYYSTCKDERHQCTLKENSTTQLWFGHEYD